MKRHLPGFFCGLGIGATLGTTLAILFAPNKGSRTRMMISRAAARAAKDSPEFLKQKQNEFLDAAADVLKRSREGIIEAFETGKRALG
jgi:gas vesicle protein